MAAEELAAFSLLCLGLRTAPQAAPGAGRSARAPVTFITGPGLRRQSCLPVAAVERWPAVIG
jgi:hypothetical protein